MTKPVNNEWLTKILETVFEAGMKKSNQYRSGSGANTLISDTFHTAEQAILSKLETIEQEAKGCVDCKTLRCENCER